MKSLIKLSIASAILVLLAAMLGDKLNIQFEILWTDALVYILVFSIAYFILESVHKEHLRAPWRHVSRRKLAMCSLVILLAYVLIGITDSIHYRVALPVAAGQSETQYSGEVESLFDALTHHLTEQPEKTYSAPFATHLYVKEIIETQEGMVRDFPRLDSAGRHLGDPEKDKVVNILINLFFAFLVSLLVWGLILSVVIFRLAKHQNRGFHETMESVFSGQQEIPWREMLLTLAVILFFISTIYILGGQYHILGTDKVGQDVLYLGLKSIRTGLVIGTLTTLIMLPFAIMLGIMAGYFRGWVDDVIQYVYTTLNSIPSVLLIAAAILSMQVYVVNHPEMFETVLERADIRLLFLCAILGITSWTSLCRLLRGETFKLSRLDYVEAATAFGVGQFKIIRQHLLPNVMHIILISIVLDFSGLVLAEAVLSYVNIGVDPVTISWGNMINAARLEMARDPMVWWSLCAAFLFMFILVLAANLFSDAVRDAFDPRISRAR